MATYTRRITHSDQHWIVRFLPLETLSNGQALAHRFKEVAGIRYYVHERKRLVLGAILLMVLIAIACAIGVVLFLADRHSLLTLLGILLLPVVLVGSFLVQAYVFFSWIEGRALERDLGHRHRPAPGAIATWLSRNLTLDMGPFPPVPWVLAVIFLVLPLAFLAATWLSFALVVVSLCIVMPVVYARVEGLTQGSARLPRNKDLKR
jgi:glucan phosphoethanolaminetransferase (alkaline phosphatase superfamily)